MKVTKLNLILFIAITVGCNSLKLTGQQLIGKSVSTIPLIDPNDKPKNIPSIGEKVVMIVYTDPDVKDVNDPLSNAIKAKNYAKDKYQGIGIANCKDTWIPNAGIRFKARQKEQQFPGSVILLDEKLLLSKTWGFGDCNESGVVIIIGKDSKIKYLKSVKTPEDSKAIIAVVTKIIEEELVK
jgi:predicted transcriptional regulator